MKKILFPILALVLAVGLAVPMASPAAAHTESDPQEVDLLAGQHIDVGEVKVWNDDTNLYVQYVIDDPWVMTGSHLYVGKTDPANFPSTPGQFPYSPGMEKSPSPNASYDGATMTYTIPLDEIYEYTFVGKGQGKGLNAVEGPGVEPCEDVWIAAHADLQKLGEVMTATLASGTQTLSVGYTETEPVDPLDPANYSGLGTWSAAVPVSSPPIPPWVDPTTELPGAVWVSSAATTEGGFGDQWRLFKEAFEIPPGAVITSASLTMTADNAVEAYLNGSPVGTTSDVYGTAPSPQHYNFAKLWGPYTLTPLVGPNTLMFVVRNWVHSAYNPTGLLYRMDYEYQLLVTETAWGDGTTFGTNWAMYFKYHIQEPCVPGVIWQIGTPDGAVNPVLGASEYLITGTIEDEGSWVWGESINYYVQDDPDPINTPQCPGVIGPFNVLVVANDGRPPIDATAQLNIRFELYCDFEEGDLVLYYDRYGSEMDNVVLNVDGTNILLGQPTATEGNFGSFSYPLPALEAGIHTISIIYMGGGSGNGHYIDYLKLVYE